MAIATANVIPADYVLGSKASPRQLYTVDKRNVEAVNLRINPKTDRTPKGILNLDVTPIAEALLSDAAALDNPQLARLADVISANAEPVRAELSLIRDYNQANAIKHAQECIIFAIISPQTPFDDNTRAVRAVMANLDNYTEETRYEILTEYGTHQFNGCGQKSVWILSAIEIIRNIKPEDMQKDTLLALAKDLGVSGLAQKTASMAVALFNENAEVFTLDVHMCRATWYALGLEYNRKPQDIEPKAYRMLEHAWIAWAQARLPQLSIFTVQWALWNIAGFGWHQSHTPIFSLSPEAEG